MSGNSFGERMGFIASPKLLKNDEISDAIRNKLVNICEAILFSEDSKGLYKDEDTKKRELIILRYAHNIKNTVNNSRYISTSQQIAEFLLNEDLAYLGGLLEIIVAEIPDLIGYFNRTFEDEKFYYRFVNGLLEPITNNEEIASIEDTCKNLLDGVKNHINKALQCFAQKPTPDYNNTAKEAYSALECIVKDIAEVNKNVNFSNALNTLGSKHGLDSQLKALIQNINRYANDNARHANNAHEVKELTHAEAKFILISCSSAVNYLTEKYYT